MVEFIILNSMLALSVSSPSKLLFRYLFIVVFFATTDCIGVCISLWRVSFGVRRYRVGSGGMMMESVPTVCRFSVPSLFDFKILPLFNACCLFVFATVEVPFACICHDRGVGLRVMNLGTLVLVWKHCWQAILSSSICVYYCILATTAVPLAPNALLKYKA